MNDLNAGDIIRVTEFFTDECRQGDQLLDQPEYALVMSDSAYDNFTTIRFLTNEDLNSYELMLHNGFDEWELVPETDVPDEVWAALAKWRLSQ